LLEIKYSIKAFYIILKIWFRFYLKQIASFKNRIYNKTNIHFLHIGKTGDSSIKSTLNNYLNTRYCIYCYDHLIKLKHISPKDKVIFSVRDPIDRFVSAFNFAKDRALPLGKLFSPAASNYLNNFENADELAIALYSDIETKREVAKKVMQLIPHLRENYWYWFGNEKYLQSRLNNIFFVFNCKCLNNNFLHFKEKIGADSNIKLPLINDSKANVNFTKHNKSLSSEGIANLKKWYSNDYKFLKFLKENQLISKVYSNYFKDW